MPARHFLIQELVPKEVYAELGDRAWSLLDDRIVAAADIIRDHFGRPVTINNWADGGKFSNRGFRLAGGPGAEFSQHRFGRGIDLDVQGLTAEEVRTAIRQNRGRFQGITRMELGVNWVHIDCAWTGKSEIVCFNP